MKTHDEIISESISLSNRTGIYFLIRDGRVVYVGQSVDVWSRIAHHAGANRHIFDSYAFEPCSRDELNDLESEYIMALKPVGNMGAPLSERYATLKMIKRLKGINQNTLKRFARMRGIEPVHQLSGTWYYRVADFAEVLP